MGFKDRFDAMYISKGDKDIAVSIRAQAEGGYQQNNGLITMISDNAGIDIDAEIKAVFADLRTALIVGRTALQDFAAAHPEFMEWRKP